MSRQAVRYNQIVGERGGAVYVLEEIFNYDDGFKGATGYSMRPVYQDEIDSENDPENVAEYCGDIWREQVASGATELGLAEWCEQVVRDSECEGRLFPLDDDSFRGDFEQAIEQATPEIQAKVKAIGGGCVAWQVEGCGRCLGELDEVWREDLAEIIKQAEGGK